MQNPVPIWRRTAGLLLLLGAAVIVSGCNTYYIPPPELAVFLSSTTTNLVVSSVNSQGQLQPSSLQLSGVADHATNPTLIYSVGQAGNYVQGGNSTLGFIDASGDYTAPLVVPTPNLVVIQAASQQDPSKTATVTLRLLNPPAQVDSVNPALVTAGTTVTFDVAGTSFAPNATVDMSGAQVVSASFVSNTQMSVTAHIQSAGLLALSVDNPFPFQAPNSVQVRSLPSSPSTSSAMAVTVDQVGAGGTPALATKAYVAENTTVAVVNLDTNQQIQSVVMPPNYQASMAVADPGLHEVLVASSASNVLQVIDTTRDDVASTIAVPVSGSTTVNGASCEVCALLVDSVRHQAILSTAAGYFVLNLAAGSFSPAIAAPAATNFAYDPVTRRIFVPFASSQGSGVQVLDLVQNTTRSVQPNGALFGAATATAAWDPTSGVLTTGDSVASQFLGLNLNNAEITGNVVSAPAAEFPVTSGCAGAWDNLALDLAGHLGWMANQSGCVAVASFAQSAQSGFPPPPSQLRWARMPAGPDGLPWVETPQSQPPTLSVYTGPDGRAYGVALRQDHAVLLKMDLGLLQNANPVVGGADSNQVDPTQAPSGGATVAAFTYIPLH